VPWTRCTDSCRAGPLTQDPSESSHRTGSIAAGSSGSSPWATRARRSSSSIWFWTCGGERQPAAALAVDGLPVARLTPDPKVCQDFHIFHSCRVKLDAVVSCEPGHNVKLEPMMDPRRITLALGAAVGAAFAAALIGLANAPAARADMGLLYLPVLPLILAGA
jgi:hypothetical protein